MCGWIQYCHYALMSGTLWEELEDNSGLAIVAWLCCIVVDLPIQRRITRGISITRAGLDMRINEM
jgi:hypothetical protein